MIENESLDTRFDMGQLRNSSIRLITLIINYLWMLKMVRDGTGFIRYLLTGYCKGDWFSLCSYICHAFSS